MSEIYSFDRVGAFSVVVDQLDDGTYEGIVFLYAVQNPHAVHSGPDVEAVREELLRIARGLG